MPLPNDLTADAAAAVLNVSPSRLSDLIRAGDLPSRTVGDFVRLRLSDLIAYRRALLASRPPPSAEPDGE